MNSVKATLMGILTGIILGALSVALGGQRLLAGSASVVGLLVAISVLHGALAGGVSSLCRIFSSVERYALSVLVNVALAALVVIVGQFGSGSLAPLLIYALAVINGLLVSVVVNNRTQSYGI